MGRQLYCLPYGVDDPSQDELSRVPATVTFEELLQGDSLIPMGLIGFRSGEHLVNGVQQVSAERFESAVATLA
ncbi:MAG TPA: hypothetical protein VGP34_06550 [Pontimonas sp.]|nr:hypothetical protein [Pontimonas sp.]